MAPSHPLLAPRVARPWNASPRRPQPRARTLRRRTHAASIPLGARLSGTSRNVTAANVGGLFFPHSNSLGLEPVVTVTLAVRGKVVHDGPTRTPFVLDDRS